MSPEEVTFRRECKRVYEALHNLVELTGLRYDDDDDYVMNKDFKTVSIDTEILAALENAHAGLKYYLGKGVVYG